MDDYVLNPATLHILQMFEEGGDAHQRGVDDTAIAKAGSDFVAGLDDFTKGVVIIDLATMFDAMRQAVLIMQTDAMEVSPDES